MGNTRVIRLPKELLEQAEIKDEVDLHVEKGRIVIRPAVKLSPRTAAAVARQLRSGRPIAELPEIDDKDEK